MRTSSGGGCGCGCGELQPPRVLRALEAFKKAASQLHLEAAAEAAALTEDSEGEGGLEDDTGDAVCGSPSMHALLEVERQSEGLLGHDPDLQPLARHLSRLRATCSARPRKPSASSSSSFLPASLASLLGLRARDEGDGEAEEIARVAAGIEEEIQAWIDRENTHRVAAALRSLMRPSSTAAEQAKAGGGEEQVIPSGCHHRQRQLLDNDEDESAVASLLSAMESRLSRGFDSRYQSALLRSGAFHSLLAALTAPPTPAAATTKLTRESCASAVAAAVRFNPAVFVGPVLACSSTSSSVARSLAGMATPNSARALGALVSAIRTPLVDEMEARGEVPSVVALLRKPAELAAAAMGAVMVMGRHGRRDAVWAMLDAGVVEKLVELELEYGPDEEDDEDQQVVRSLWKKKLGVKAGEVGIIDVVHHAMPTVDSVSFQGCVTRFAIQVQTGRGMGRRDKREARAELVRRIRAAADADHRAGNILAEVLWDIT